MTRPSRSTRVSPGFSPSTPNLTLWWVWPTPFVIEDLVDWTSLSNRSKRKLLKPLYESYKFFKDQFFHVTPSDIGPNLLVDNARDSYLFLVGSTWMTSAHHEKPWLRRVVSARLTRPRTKCLCRSNSPIKSDPLHCPRRQSTLAATSLLKKLAAQATQGSWARLKVFEFTFYISLDFFISLALVLYTHGSARRSQRCFSRLMKRKLETEKPKIVKGDCLDYQRTQELKTLRKEVSRSPTSVDSISLTLAVSTKPIAVSIEEASIPPPTIVLDSPNGSPMKEVGALDDQERPGKRVTLANLEVGVGESTGFGVGKTAPHAGDNWETILASRPSSPLVWASAHPWLIWWIDTYLSFG
ncbi:hypothetical protein CR513_39372, partial [Mucuna pruriens]